MANCFAYLCVYIVSLHIISVGFSAVRFDKSGMRRPHIVPLSRQVMDILTLARGHSKGSKYVFPTLRTLERPLSDMAMHRMNIGGRSLTVMESPTTMARCMEAILLTKEAFFAPQTATSPTGL